MQMSINSSSLQSTRLQPQATGLAFLLHAHPRLPPAPLLGTSTPPNPINASQCCQIGREICCTHNSVAIYPGATQLTLIPSPAHSTAKLAAKCLTAALAALYGVCGWGTLTIEPDMLPMKIRLAPRSTASGRDPPSPPPLAAADARRSRRATTPLATSVAHSHVPSTFTLHSRRARSTGYSVAAWFSVNPADVTRMSTAPWGRCAASTSPWQACTLGGQDTSQRWAVMRGGGAEGVDERLDERMEAAVEASSTAHARRGVLKCWLLL